jgi:hypothetical protein
MLQERPLHSQKISIIMCPYFGHRHNTENSEQGISTKIEGFYKNLKFTLVTGDFLRNTKEEILTSNLRIIVSCKWLLSQAEIIWALNW